MLHEQIFVSLESESVTICVCYQNGCELSAGFKGASLARNLVDYVDGAERLIRNVVH